MMDSQPKQFVCFGEILMDQFQDEKKIGGAPLNLAVWLAKMKQNVSMISGVGTDEDGKKLLDYLTENGVSTKYIQKNEHLPTGIVSVNLDSEGSATYKIPHPVAWDKVEYSDSMADRVSKADAFFYSTLPARDEINFRTITQLLKKAAFKILDVNLRSPHYTEKTLKAFCDSADFIKMNDDELFEIAEMYDSTAKSIEDNLFHLQKQTKTATLCVTKGRHGAVVLHDKKLTYFSGYRIDKVEDTVGSGDSFLAAFISKFLQGTDVATCLRFACAVGAFVASKRGANPSIQNNELHKFIQTLS